MKALKARISIIQAHQNTALTFMPSLIEPREREIPILSDLAAYTYTAEDRHVACCLEFLGHGIVNRCRDFLATDPITHKVSVAIHKCYFDATVEKIVDNVEAVWAEEITCAVECFGNRNVLRTVVDWYA
jgi:hypothetical protein